MCIEPAVAEDWKKGERRVTSGPDFPMAASGLFIQVIKSNYGCDRYSHNRTIKVLDKLRHRR